MNDDIAMMATLKCAHRSNFEVSFLSDEARNWYMG